MAKVFSPEGKELNSVEIAAYANGLYKDHRYRFTSLDFIPGISGEGNQRYRLRMSMCDCGYDDNAPGKPSFGEFVLFPHDSAEDQEGQKCYMRCRKCGAVSHL